MAMNTVMTSKERVLRAIQGKDTDRVPVDVGLTTEMRDKLLEHFAFETDADLYRIFGGDFRGVHASYIGPQRFTPEGELADAFGVAGGGPTYADSIGYRPMARVETVAEVDAFDWPDPEWWDHSAIEEQCLENAEYAITGGEWSPFFCAACNMTGIGRFLEIMLELPDVAEAIMSHIVDLYVASTRRDLEAGDGRIDIFFMGDDYGGKNGLLMSPSLWRKLIKPQLARLYSLASEYDVIMMQHCCGGIRPVIGDMIKLGLQVLDPVQIAAAEMEPEGLKAEFGDRLTFHGGVNTEATLPFGTADEVYEETTYLMNTLGRGGGYIVCGSQHLQNDIPVENVIAMYRAAGSYDPDR
jgi:uroporphyrinogen decarboxylase